MTPPNPRSARRTGSGGVLQGAVIVLGGIVFADMLCEGAAADWAAVYLHNSLHAVPLVAGLAFAAYALAMLAVRLSGNRLFTRFAAHRLLPLLAAIASLGFAAGLVIGRPVGVLLGFALLGAGLGGVVPMILSAAGAVSNVDTGKAVAAVAGCGWAGYVVGPVVIGEIASTTHAAHRPVPDPGAHGHRGRGHRDGEGAAAWGDRATAGQCQSVDNGISESTRPVSIESLGRSEVVDGLASDGLGGEVGADPVDDG